MNKIFVLVGTLTIFGAKAEGLVQGNQPIMPDKMTLQEATEELQNLLLHKERVLAVKEKMLAKLRTITKGGYAAGGTLLELHNQLKMISNAEENLVDKIAQLIKQHPELMKYLPPDVGLLPIMPFLPVPPLRKRIMPQIKMP